MNTIYNFEFIEVVTTCGKGVVAIGILIDFITVVFRTTCTLILGLPRTVSLRKSCVVSVGNNVFI